MLRHYHASSGNTWIDFTSRGMVFVTVVKRCKHDQHGFLHCCGCWGDCCSTTRQVTWKEINRVMFDKLDHFQSTKKHHNSSFSQQNCCLNDQNKQGDRAKNQLSNQKLLNAAWHGYNHFLRKECNTKFALGTCFAVLTLTSLQSILLEWQPSQLWTQGWWFDSCTDHVCWLMVKDNAMMASLCLTAFLLVETYQNWIETTHGWPMHKFIRGKRHEN